MMMSEILATAGATAAVVVPVAGVAVGYMRMYVDQQIKGLKLEIASVQDLIGRRSDELYVRRGECFLMHGEVKGRIDRAESRLSKLEEAL